MPYPAMHLCSAGIAFHALQLLAPWSRLSRKCAFENGLDLIEQRLDLTQAGHSDHMATGFAPGVLRGIEWLAAASACDGELLLGFVDL